MTCATKTLPIRRLPGATFGRCASRKNCRCCAIICCGSIASSRHDRFHGFMDDGFIERYAAKCADDGTVIIAYIEDGVVRGAAELHPPDQSPDALPEIAFSVEACVRRRGVGSILFRKLIAEARSKGYHSLRITTGAQNEAMRALASKFGAHLTFRHGESTGSIDLKQQLQPELREAVRSRPRSMPCARSSTSIARTGRLLLQMYGLGTDGLTGGGWSAAIADLTVKRLRAK